MQFAPRYDPRLLAALRSLDDRKEPIAELCRRLGCEAERIGVPRPSYVHVRRIVLAERLREDEIRREREQVRAIVKRAGEDLLLGRFVDAYEVADKIARARCRSP